MTAAESFANDAAAAVSVSGGIGGVVTPGTVETWTVLDASTLPAAVTGTSQWHGLNPAAPAEKFLVTNISGTTLTVTRAVEGPAVDHTAGGKLAGFVIRPAVTAAVLEAFGTGGGGGGSVSSVTAGDASIAVAGTGTAPTVETGTLDQIAALHPPAANWSNNSKKITSLANGSGAQDAAAYGQTPAGGNTVSIGQGGTGQTGQQAALDALAGATTASEVLAGNGTHVTLRALVAADLPAATTGARGAVQLDGTVGDIQPVGSGAALGASGKVPDAAHVHLGITVLATTTATGTTGVALANGTPTILSWTAPADGNMHRVSVTVVLHVATAETGGAIQITWTAPDGTGGSAVSAYAGGAGTGTVKTFSADFLIGPGSAIAVAQSSALTGGSATVWAEIKGY